jgi:hypothetical protein
MTPKNKQRESELRRARYLRNRDLEREKQRIYREQNRQRIREQQAEHRKQNRDAINAKRRAIRAANIEKFRERERAKHKSPEQRARAVEKTRQWVAANKERQLAWTRSYRRRRTDADPAYKATIAIRRRFYMAIRNQVYDGWNIRSGAAVRLLGCTMAEFVSHVESLWLPGMTWANWSRDGWHIDHIVPLAAFDLSDEEQCKKACHYTNLCPLWAKANLAKGSKVLS